MTQGDDKKDLFNQVVEHLKWRKWNEAIDAAMKSLDLSESEIRLACGELTKSEMLTVLAVLNWRKNEIRKLKVKP